MRKIEKKMIDFLEAKLASNGYYHEAVKNKNARLIFILAAQACVGIREIGGNNKGPIVELIQETIGGADKEPWCMSFVQTCLAFAEYKTGIASKVAPGELCSAVWNQTPKSMRVKKIPAAGAIAIWVYPPGTKGHTGVVIEYIGPKMATVEGNTEKGLNTKGQIEREGGGVYAPERSTKSTPKMKLLGFLKPF